MAATHDVHRFIEENLFGPFQRPSNTFHNSYRSLTASDLLSQRSASTTNRIPSSTIPQQYKCRPASDILQAKTKSSPEAEAIDQWFENIQKYEQMLEEVAAASLDQGFKDELNQINKWFRCRSDAERTAAFYTVVQNASQIQIRFLITVLQQIANGGEPYPAGQENESDIHTYSTRKNNVYAPTFSSQSVISTESEYEARKRLAAKTAPIGTRKVACMSEPDIGRNRDLFVSRPLGLSHPGPLYEKALAARHALNNNDLFSSSSSSNSSSTSSSSSTSPNNPHGSTGGLFASPPHARLRTSLSTTDLKTPSLFKNNTETKDWPFPPSYTNTNNDDAKTSWSFGSLRSKKLPWSIQEEEHENYSKLSATIQSSLDTLEQAQARLKKDLPSAYTTTPIVQTPMPVAMRYEDDDQSDTSSNKEKPLTGLARRRKRSSAARALKDKIAAETVDFELMKDVQNWMRSLRLHKYGHAFIGLDWKQVIRMTDEDMEIAGVNTIGARRKLLKVFENVQNHCEENDIEF